MEDKRLMLRGFISVKDEELQLSGGISPETIKRIARIVGYVLDFISTYSSDFNKGYKKGLEGKPFFQLMPTTVR
ncbi:MAG: hypothetical protein J6Z32_06655 [Bacteroidales bacterium]|nr:hypothetical protein [Bacteroidales bacterium]